MLNRVCLYGRLSATPELQTTAAGAHVTTISIACQRTVKKDSTDFFTVVAWGKTADIICQYFSKGSPIIVDGRLETREWLDKNGGKRKAVEIIAEQIFFAGNKPDMAYGNASRDAEGYKNMELLPLTDDDGELPF